MNPLISVITPVYNSEDLVGKTIQSVLDQTYENWELILVDDGSTDSSGDICDHFAEKDARIRVIHKPNGGVSSARNVGLAAAEGEYITWLDSDDWFANDMLESTLSAAREYNVSAVLCNYENVSAKGKRQRRYEFEENIVLNREEALKWLLSVKLTESLWANLIERRFYAGIVFPEGKLFEDISVVYKLYEQQDRIAVIIKPLLSRQIRSDSISHVRSVKNRVDALNAYIARSDDLAERYPALSDVFARTRICQMQKLRRCILGCSVREYLKYRKDMYRMAGYYRKRKRVALSAYPGFAAWLEFVFLTSGTLFGFYFSRLIGEFHPKKTWLKDRTE